MMGFVSVVVMPIAFVARARQAGLRRLGAPAAEGLVRLAGPYFDAPPETRSVGAVGIIEGRRAGQALEIRANYEVGERSSPKVPRADIIVTIALRGATPKLSVVHWNQVATEFEERWHGEGEEGRHGVGDGE